MYIHVIQFSVFISVQESTFVIIFLSFLCYIKLMCIVLVYRRMQCIKNEIVDFCEIVTIIFVCVYALQVVLVVKKELVCLSLLKIIITKMFC